MDNFSIIAFTPEVPRNNEVEWIKYLLTHPSHTISRVHLRHPGYDIRPILESIPPEFLNKITIHDQSELIAEYPSLGFHFNSRSPYKHLPGNGLRSQSCHSIRELHNLPKLDYVTLSPIFKSISKVGYEGVPELLKAGTKNKVPVIALGGVTPDNLKMLNGFSGAAMLGSLNHPINKLEEILKLIKNQTQKLCSSL